MASIFSTAKYILESKGDISAMKLQKLCYYSQAWHMVWAEQPLFKEDFEAWANGPVSPELYEKHRGQFSVSKKTFEGTKDDLSDTEKESINAVLGHYGDKTAQWLSDLTHMEDPWINTRESAMALDGARCNEIISKGEMHRYYSGL